MKIGKATNLSADARKFLESIEIKIESENSRGRAVDTLVVKKTGHRKPVFEVASEDGGVSSYFQAKYLGLTARSYIDIDAAEVTPNVKLTMGYIARELQAAFERQPTENEMRDVTQAIRHSSPVWSRSAQRGRREVLLTRVPEVPRFPAAASGVRKQRSNFALVMGCRRIGVHVTAAGRAGPNIFHCGQPCSERNQY
jgi:hypothetical protein